MGGFGESQYLHEQIKSHLELQDIALRRPDTSWTAVVQGAVIAGTEKSSSQKWISAGYCRHSYAISVQQEFSDTFHSIADLAVDSTSGLPTVQGQLIWFLNEGDLVQSNAPLTVTQAINLNFSKTDSKIKRIPVYRYSNDADRERPTRWNEAREGKLDAACEMSEANLPL